MSNYYPVLYDFKDTLVGQYRWFDDDNQNIRVRLSSQAKTGGRSEDFTVRLQRNVAVAGYTTVGTAKFPRNGLKEVTFKNLPAGFYRLRFEKSTDGIQVIGIGFYEN